MYHYYRPEEGFDPPTTILFCKYALPCYDCAIP